MTTTHTPGPWRINADASVGACCHPPFRVADACWNTVRMPGHPLTHEQAMANAALIAAAPELLKSLKSLLDGGIADPAEVAKAHAAISKAEGCA